MVFGGQGIRKRNVYWLGVCQLVFEDEKPGSRALSESESPAYGDHTVFRDLRIRGVVVVEG